MILTPKDWKSFQHYRDRNPPWIKLHKSLLDNWEFQCLPDASRALAPMLWLLASEKTDGVINLSDEALSFRLRMSITKIMEAVEPLVSKGFFICDSTALAPCKPNADSEERRGEKSRDREEKKAPSGATRKRRTRDEIILGFSEDVKTVVKALAPIWPTEGIEGDKTSPTSPQDFCQRVSEILDAGNSPDILIQAAKDYIAIPKRKYAAPQFFFGKTGYGGKGEAPWVGFVKFILTKRQHANTAP